MDLILRALKRTYRSSKPTGLPPDIEVTQIAGDLLDAMQVGIPKRAACTLRPPIHPVALILAEKERRQRDSELHYKGGSTDTSATALKDPKVPNDEWSAHHDSIRMLRGGTAAPPAAHMQQQQQQQQQQQAQQRYDKVPAPAYPPQILFRYPNGSAPPIRDREVCDLCFPHQVNAGILFMKTSGFCRPGARRGEKMLMFWQRVHTIDAAKLKDKLCPANNHHVTFSLRSSTTLLYHLIAVCDSLQGQASTAQRVPLCPKRGMECKI
eukprot:1158249-Pelagomonas_calceolata.AAC.7